MTYGMQRIPYPAENDFGPRSGYPTLAFLVHMAEGTSVAEYLSRDPARGVSVHYTCEQKTARWEDGEIVRCLPEQRISGSVNPDTIRTTEGPYFGARHAKDALGRFWRNPNVAVISMEVAGRAKDGPTPAQVESMVALFTELQRRYPGIVPLGHADLQDVKPCPGTSFQMKRAFELMGGHGLQHGAPTEVPMSTVGYQSNQVCDVRDGADLFDAPGGKKIGDVGAPLVRDYLGRSAPAGWCLISSELDGRSRTAWVRASAVSNIRTTPRVPAPDCSQSIEEAKRTTRAADIAAIEALP